VPGTAVITVPVPVATVTVSPTTARLSAGQTVQLGAMLKDASGLTLAGRTVAWTSSDTTVARVSEIGLVMAVSVGSATITATAEGRTGTMATTVVGWRLVRAGGSYTCGLLTSGLAYCWGWNAFGNLGDGSTTSRALPVAVGGGLTFDSLSVGGGTACALDPTGRAYCWGGGAYGELGNGASSNRGLPQVVSGGLTYKQIAAGGMASTLNYNYSSAGHVCAIAGSGTAWCWGANSSGQLGDGTTASRNSPSAVSGGLLFTAIAAGGSHTCGLTAAGVAYCWGANGSGQLGDGTTTSRNVPTSVLAGGVAFRSLQAGRNYTCGLSTQGYLYCWGGNDFGQFGDGTRNANTVPALAGGGSAWSGLGVSAAEDLYTASGLDELSGHTCATDASGSAFCWGGNHFDQVGTATPSVYYDYETSPRAVQGGYHFGGITAGSFHTCGVTTAGTALCWGFGSDGQLGSGTGASSASPVIVSLP
jgi:alpha-tubulin suppressor-like RCC1 family protein